MKKAIPTLILFAISLVSFRNLEHSEQKITYQNRVKQFLDKECIHCHSEHARHSYYPFGGNIYPYDSLKKQVDNGKLYDHVFVKKDMPPSRAWSVARQLDTADLLMLDSWIKAGAPEK